MDESCAGLRVDTTALVYHPVCVCEYGTTTDQVVVVVRKDLLGVVPACENALAVRVIGEKRDEAASARRQQLDDIAHFRLRHGFLASVLTATRARTRIRCTITNNSMTISLVHGEREQRGHAPSQSEVCPLSPAPLPSKRNCLV